MVATKQEDGKTIHQLEDKLHRLKVMDKVQRSFKRDHTGRGNNAPVKPPKLDAAGNPIARKGPSAEQILLHEDVQQICNPHDSEYNRQAKLFPVMGDVETAAYLDVDSVVVNYPTANDSWANLTTSQTCGILYNDYVRNTVTYTVLPAASGTAQPGGAMRYDALFTPVLDASNTYIVSSIPALSCRIGISYIPCDLPFAYFRNNPIGQLSPHGSILGMGQSDRFGGNYVYQDAFSRMNINIINNGGTAASVLGFVEKYTPGGPVRVQSAVNSGSIASGAQGTVSFINSTGGDGYFRYRLYSPDAAAASTFTVTASFGNYDTNGTLPGTNYSGQTHCWAHLPVPGFQTVAPLMEQVRINGTVLEYHNTGSVTNGEIYCAQFSGQDWTEVVNNGFTSILSQTRDNSLSQSGDKPQGALVRLNFGAGKDPLELQQQHKHQLGQLTSLFFPLDNPGSFCMLFSTVSAGNLGAPQQAVWKRGCHVQFQTTDTTRSPAVSTMSRSHFRAVVAIASQVPFFGPNEFHWSDVKDWINTIIDKAVKVAPIAQGLLAMI